MGSEFPVDPDTWVAIDRARAAVVEVLSERLKFLEDEKARMPELVEQVEAILARKGQPKRPKQELTKSQVEILEHAETEGIAPKRMPRSLRPAWWSEVEQLIVVLRRNLVKDAADKIENEVNYEVGGFYSCVMPKDDELDHYRERKAAEEKSARWLREYLLAPWLRDYLRAKVSHQAVAKPVAPDRATSNAGPATQDGHALGDRGGETDQNMPARTASYQSKYVKLFGVAEAPEVCGKIKPTLTAARYATVKALIEAGNAGLTKDQLDEKSGRGDARKTLKRLAKSDGDWESVLLFAGTTGKGYRIR